MEVQKHKGSEECFWTEFPQLLPARVPRICYSFPLLLLQSPSPKNTHEPGSLQYYTKAPLNSLENLNLYKTVCSAVASGEQRANCFAPKSMTRDTLGFRRNCNSFDFHTCLEFFIYSLY